MPGGLVQSFIDTIGTHDDFVRGGTLAPTVKINFRDGVSAVDRTFGQNGLGPFSYLSHQRQRRRRRPLQVVHQ